MQPPTIPVLSYCDVEWNHVVTLATVAGHLYLRRLCKVTHGFPQPEGPVEVGRAPCCVGNLPSKRAACPSPLFSNGLFSLPADGGVL